MRQTTIALLLPATSKTCSCQSTKLINAVRVGLKADDGLCYAGLLRAAQCFDTAGASAALLARGRRGRNHTDRSALLRPQRGRVTWWQRCSGLAFKQVPNWSFLGGDLRCQKLSLLAVVTDRARTGPRRPPAGPTLISINPPRHSDINHRGEKSSNQFRARAWRLGSCGRKTRNSRFWQLPNLGENTQEHRSTKDKHVWC